ncbi:MAG: hypothetical protein Q4D40_06485 [Eubacteriales bacterium]|nr:hypothetical protein [Eubacteriales bacterium]
MKVDLKYYMKLTGRYISVLLASAVAGVLLLCLVFLLPTAPMKEHLKYDVEELQQEGQYPALEYRYDKMLDNFTDTYMLGSAVYDDGDYSFMQRVMNAYHPNVEGLDSKNSVIDSFVYYIQDQDGVSGVDYPRYWHGYLVGLKPVLVFTDYLIWRTINRVLQLVLLAVTSIVLIRRISWKCLIPYLGGMVFLRLGVIYYSLQYSTMFYVSNIAVLLMALFKDKLFERKWFGYYFFILGIITNYFDYLTYPMLGLGVSMVIYQLMCQENTLVKRLSDVVRLSVLWALGYAGMWISKWLISSVILGRNIVADGLASVMTRSSADAMGSSISRTMAVMNNLMTGFTNGAGVYYIAAIAVGLAAGIWQWRKDIKGLLANAAVMLLIAAMPFVWFMVLANHSYLHGYFTYRILGITCAAMLAVGIKVNTKKESRK